MNSAAPATAASASSSAPRAAPGCGAVSSIAAIAGVTNSTRVCAAREARLRDLFSAPLCSDTATKSSPVSAPARPPVVTAKSRHACGAYAMDQNLTPRVGGSYKPAARPRRPPAPLRRALMERGALPRFALWPAGALSLLRSAPLLSGGGAGLVPCLGDLLDGRRPEHHGAGALAADPGEPEQAGQEAHGAEPEGGQRDDVSDLGDLPPAVGVQQHAAQRLALEHGVDQAGQLGVVRLGQRLGGQMAVGLATGHVGDV